MRNWFKPLNYFFSSFFIFYFLFLVSRVFLERMPRNFWFFCLIYIFFVSLQLLIPKIFQFFIRNSKQDLEEMGEKPFLKKIKIISLFLKIRNLFLEFFTEFFKDFFFKFLGKIYFQIFFNYLIKTFEKIIDYKKIIIFLFLIFPWTLFILIFLNESYETTLYFSLYLLSTNFLIKSFLKITIFFSLKYVLIPSNNLFIVYLQKIKENPECESFFLSHPVMKEMFLSNFVELQDKKTLVFLWELFSGIYYPYCLKIKLEILRYEIGKITKFLRLLNLVIFIEIVFFKIFSEELDIFYVFLIFVGVFISFLIFLDYFVDNNVEMKKINYC